MPVSKSAAKPGSSKDKIKKLVAALFPQQRRAFRDKGKRKSVLVGRRGGKTHYFATELIVQCLSVPGSRCVYVSTTKEQARDLLWDHPSMGLVAANKTYKLGITFNGTYKTATFPNGSIIRLLGTSKRDDIERERGKPLDLGIIDECASIRDKLLRRLIEKVFGPGIKDRAGRIIIGGTPGHILAGVFFQATRNDPENAKDGHDTHRPYLKRAKMGDDVVWSSHRWVVKDNKSMPHLWRECLEEKRLRRWADDDPTWVTEYLGEWAADTKLLIYLLDDKLNTRAASMPPHTFEVVAGCHHDKDGTFAVTAFAHSSTYPRMIELFSAETEDAQIRDMVELCDMARETCREEVGRSIDMLAGNVSTTLRDDLADRSIYVAQPPDQSQRDLQLMINDDASDGRIKLIGGGALVSQLNVLQWEDRDRERINEQCESALSDAFVAAYQFSEHRYVPLKAPAGIEVGSPAWWKQEERRQELAACAEESAIKVPTELDGLDGDYGYQVD